MYYLLLFHGNNGDSNMPEYYIRHTLSAMLTLSAVLQYHQYAAATVLLQQGVYILHVEDSPVSWS
jgi:hypothetical protein